MVKLIKNEPIAATNVQQFCVFVVVTIYRSGNLHHAVFLIHLKSAQWTTLSINLRWIVFPPKNIVKKFTEFRLLSREILQRSLFFQSHQKRSFVIEYLFPNFKDIFDDFHVVIRLQPKILFRTVQHQLIRKSGKSKLPDSLYGNAPLEMTSIENVQRERTDG